MSDTVVLVAVLGCCLSSSAAGAFCAYWFVYLREFDKKSDAVIIDERVVIYDIPRPTPEKDLVVMYGGVGTDVRYATYRVTNDEADEIRGGLQIEYQSRVSSKEARSRFKFATTGRTVMDIGIPVNSYTTAGPSGSPSKAPSTSIPPTKAPSTSAPKTTPPKTTAPKK